MKYIRNIGVLLFLYVLFSAQNWYSIHEYNQDNYFYQIGRNDKIVSFTLHEERFSESVRIDQAGNVILSGDTLFCDEKIFYIIKTVIDSTVFMM